MSTLDPRNPQDKSQNQRQSDNNRSNQNKPAINPSREANHEHNRNASNLNSNAQKFEQRDPKRSQPGEGLGKDKERQGGSNPQKSRKI